MSDSPSSSRRNRRGSRGPRRSREDYFQGEPLIVESTDQLVDVCAQLREEGSFAFDTEFVMEDVFQPEICLVQLAGDESAAIVDPLDGIELGPVWALVADPDVEVIVHAGMEDLALCQDQGGCTPVNVFDCQLACGLVTTDYPLSLARLARYLLGIRLHKSQTLTDWRKRPLTEAQLSYATDDVRYLPAARRALHGKLERSGRTDWAREEMARFERAEIYARGASDSVLKLKGAGGLDGQGLAIARALVSARADLAHGYNRPARAVLRDHLIIEIARHRWTQPSQIKTLRGLNMKASAVNQLAEAVKRAAALPPEEWPTPAPVDDETEAEAALALLAGAVIRSKCAEDNIAHQLVATRKDMRAFVRSIVRDEPDEDLPLATGWRSDHIGKLLRDVLAGTRKIGVKVDGSERQIRVD
jgi:ribonuclease D